MMLFLVDLPAPVHGMSAINRSFLLSLQSKQVPIKIINTVPSYAAKYFGKWSWTPLKILHSLACIFRLLFFSVRHPGSIVYRSVNGGIGQLFDFFYFSLCRLFGMKLYIHHHSFSYLNRPSRLFALINHVAGNKTVHIVLGDGMGERLASLYGIRGERIRVQSNLAFFELNEKKEPSHTSPRLTIGHLANLTFDKGLDTFVDVCYRLAQHNIEFDAYIAGPIANDAVKAVIDKAIKNLPSVNYIGPLYGEDKQKFYQQLDVFIFPSKYVNEAEPLVLYEAATHGALLIGTQRGCMQQVIDKLGGYSLQEDISLPDAIATILRQAQRESAFESPQRILRSEQFQLFQKKAKESLEGLIAEFKPSYVSKS